MFSIEKRKGLEAATIVLKLSLGTDLKQTVGEGCFSQVLVNFSIFYSALIDKLDQRVYGQLLPRLVGESKELFLGLVAWCFETKWFIPSGWFEEGRSLVALVYFGRGWMRNRGQEKEREVLVLMLWLRLCSMPGLGCSAWHCPVEKHFLTLCAMFWWLQSYPGSLSLHWWLWCQASSISFDKILLKILSVFCVYNKLHYKTSIQFQKPYWKAFHENTTGSLLSVRLLMLFINIEVVWVGSYVCLRNSTLSGMVVTWKIASAAVGNQSAKSYVISRFGSLCTL